MAASSISPQTFSPQTSPRWDPWVLKDGDTYHLFYLGGRTDQDPWWKTSWICGARSDDFRHWQHIGRVLEPVPSNSDREGPHRGWESGRLFAGSTYKAEGRYYLFYSAASEADIAQEAIGLATSADGVQWQRSEQPLLSFAQAANVQAPLGVSYAGRCQWANHLHWRDPYVVQSVETQKYYLFFCASLTHINRYQGGLGVAVANRLEGPYRLLPPAAGPGIQQKLTRETDDSLWPFYHLERPQVIFCQGRYHLFFSCFKDFVDPAWLAQVGPQNVGDSTLYWYVADDITGPFTPIADLPVVPGSQETGLYGTSFFKLPSKAVGSKGTVFKPSDAVEMTVLGWYHQNYRLAIAQEFSAIWTPESLRIVANRDSDRNTE